MIAIVDYGAGNIQSVANVFKTLGEAVVVTSDPAVITKADGVVFPGVGAAGSTMSTLKELGLDVAVTKAAKSGKPFIAVCVGMQVLFDKSEENSTDCLGIFKGEVKRFPSSLKTPQIGWNSVHFTKDCPLFEGIKNDSYFYFVHSYFCSPFAQAVTTATTEYGFSYCSAVWQDNIYAVQFHPEKSGVDGLRIYSNFIKQVEKHKAEKYD